MQQKLTILVVGATGAQGGSVTRHLLKTKSYNIRALSRTPNSHNAKSLQAAGVELVKGDLEDRASLRRALKDCYGAFGVTDYWEHFDKEYDHGINFIDSARNSGLQHVVLHTLPSPRKISDGRLRVSQMDTKAELEDYARMLCIPATFLHVSFYYCNFLKLFPAKPTQGGAWEISVPMGESKMQAVAVEDIGGVVSKIFAEGDRFKHTVVRVVGDEMSLDEYADVLTKVLHRKYVYKPRAYPTSTTSSFSDSHELANMFEFARSFSQSNKMDIELCKALYPNIRTFEQWVGDNTHRFLTAR